MHCLAIRRGKSPPHAPLGFRLCLQTQLLLAARASLENPALLPVRASRALWLSLSDLCLRSWPAQPAAQFDAAARGAAFADLTRPLVLTFQQAAAAGHAANGGEASLAVAAAARHAGAVAAAIVQSYAGSPKVGRLQGRGNVPPCISTAPQCCRVAASAALCSAVWLPPSPRQLCKC